MCFLWGLLLQHRGTPRLRKGPGCFSEGKEALLISLLSKQGWGATLNGRGAVLGVLADTWDFLGALLCLCFREEGVCLLCLCLAQAWSLGSGRAPHVARAVPGTVPPFSSFPSPF